MNKQIAVLLCMLFMPLFISSCGAKYARPDRCVCGEIDEEPAKEEAFKKAFKEKAQEEVFTIKAGS